MSRHWTIQITTRIACHEWNCSEKAMEAAPTDAKTHAVEMAANTTALSRTIASGAALSDREGLFAYLTDVAPANNAGQWRPAKDDQNAAETLSARSLHETG